MDQPERVISNLTFAVYDLIPDTCSQKTWTRRTKF